MCQPSQLNLSSFGAFSGVTTCGYRDEPVVHWLTSQLNLSIIEISSGIALNEHPRRELLQGQNYSCHGCDSVG
jgi:hypothetical protein